MDIMSFGEYDAGEVVGRLSRYAELRRKTLGLSAEQLKGSEDYRQILLIETSLMGLRLTGTDLLEITDHIDRIATPEYVRESISYKDLEKAYSELEWEKKQVEERHRQLRRNLESAINVFQPVFALKRILEEDKESKK